MIYFDNAATSFPKPPAVLRETGRCMKYYCGNPGRSSHKLSLEAATKIYECRTQIAELFGSDSPENTVFTYNTTYALNMAIKSILKKGDHVLISDLEHNSVLRPIAALRKKGVIDYDIFPAAECPEEDIPIEIEKRIKPNTKALICTHASNVCGVVLPIEKIGEICKKAGIVFILDAAQSAGIYDIDIKKMNVDILCAPGHKGLLGPQGTGFAVFSDVLEPSTFIEGGNGVNSLEEEMPDFLPERFEAGTPATPAIAGLCEGIKYIQALGLDNIRKQEHDIAFRLREVLQNTKGVTLYAPGALGNTLLFNIDGLSSNKAAAEFDADGICLRSGFHCSPLAHAALGTGENGALRASLGIFNRVEEIDVFYKRLKEIIFTA